jgi:hypothetical protein
MVGTDGSERAFIIHKGIGLVREVYSEEGLNEFDGVHGGDAHTHMCVQVVTCALVTTVTRHPARNRASIAYSRSLCTRSPACWPSLTTVNW